MEAAGLGLVHGSGERVDREAEGLDVELKGADAIDGAGDLEIHGPEGVLDAEDVREDDGVRRVVEEDAHRDAGDVRPERDLGGGRARSERSKHVPLGSLRISPRPDLKST